MRTSAQYKFMAERHEAMMKVFEKAKEMDDAEWYKAFALLSIACSLDEIEASRELEK